MAIRAGQQLEVLVEKPAAGGRMIARHDGEVLLVAGAIPGERVLARVTRAEKRVAFASTARVLEPSPDRRDVDTDPACGGCVYAIVDYARQLELKSEIVHDAFTRIGHIPVDAPIAVQGSAVRGYRMRARFHVRDGKPGFYREGTHELCDARQTGQLQNGSVEAVEAAVASLTAQGIAVTSIELSENVAGDQRAMHIDLGHRRNTEEIQSFGSHRRNTGETQGSIGHRGNTGETQGSIGHRRNTGETQGSIGHRGNTGETQGSIGHRRNTGETQAAIGHRRNTEKTQGAVRGITAALETAVRAAELTGATARGDIGFYSVGDPIVSDPLSVLTGDASLGGALRRHPEAFFQANRFLIAPLVRAVMAAIDDGPVLDLYAGVGLFSVALAAAGRDAVSAVEGDPVSSRDLQRNAAQCAGRLRVIRRSVEAFLGSGAQPPPRSVIVDPPRTGMSKGASDAIARMGAARVVYVSCDPPTMARDGRRLIDAGYRLVSLRGFDLFPNTPHVETLGVFER